jgi:hypothetical protein
VTWTTTNDFLPDIYVLNPGEDVFVIGYPLSFHDHLFNLPILRSAMIASAYGVPFQGAPVFLTDGNLHPGMSGGPVVTKPKSTWMQRDGGVSMMTGTPYYVLGVHSATVSAGPGAAKLPLGLGVAWYARLLPEIAARGR